MRSFPSVDIAVDPLDGTSLTATGREGAIAVSDEAPPPSCFTQHGSDHAMGLPIYFRAPLSPFLGAAAADDALILLQLMTAPLPPFRSSLSGRRERSLTPGHACTWRSLPSAQR